VILKKEIMKFSLASIKNYNEDTFWIFVKMLLILHMLKTPWWLLNTF